MGEIFQKKKNPNNKEWYEFSLFGYDEPPTPMGMIVDFSVLLSRGCIIFSSCPGTSTEVGSKGLNVV